MTESVTLIHGDCLQEMKKMADKSIDLIVTDPPYGIGEAAGKNKSRSKLAIAKDYGDSAWDDAIPSAEYFAEMMRVSKNQIIFGGNYFLEHLYNSPCWIVWDKDNGENDFADCELAWTSFKTAVRRIKYRWAGMLQEDMKNKDRRVHPTQKPLHVMRWIIEKYSEPSDVICDPFLGSGTTALAALQLGRQCIGIEKDEGYYKVASERIAGAQLDLFNPSI